MSIETLRRILPPPINPELGGTVLDWPAIEKQFSPLPESYKEFMSHYGLGKIDHFMIIYSPVAMDQYLNLLTRGRIDLDVLHTLKEKHGSREVPYALFPEPNGLLPFGIDENGDGLYWLTVGHPDQWPIVVNEGRAPEYRRFDMALSEFLVGILSKTIRCDIFPDDFPNALHSFTPIVPQS